MKIKKVVLPVAGMGTRFLPVTKVIPKELLPVGNKPVVQHLVEEAILSGIEEVIFVISKEKELIRHHFSHHPELEDTLTKRGKHDLLKRVNSIHEMADFKFVYQDEPLGDGHAILMAEELLGNEPFLVLFGDDIVRSEVPAAKQLIDHFTGDSLLAVERIPIEKSSMYGIINPKRGEGRLHEVIDMVEKPAPHQAPSELGIIGKYICTPEIFEALRSAEASHGGEIRLLDGLKRIRKDQNIWAVEIEGERFDTGHPEGLSDASRAYL